MRPLQLVHAADLEPGKTYLIQEKRPEYAHLKCKGTFVKNQYPVHAYQCTRTHFTHVVSTGNFFRIFRIPKYIDIWPAIWSKWLKIPHHIKVSWSPDRPKSRDLLWSHALWSHPIGPVHIPQTIYGLK